VSSWWPLLLIAVPRSPWLRWPLLALTVPYGLLIKARLALYGWGWLPRHRLPCRVISVGNLTVGGTGKTPMVIAVVGCLQAQGHRVGVLSRGYRRRSERTQVLVSDGSKVLVGPEEAGDEPILIASRCPGTVVAVGADRYRLGRWVLAQFPLTCLVLDDGFQHLALHRDVDLLLVDAASPEGLQDLLPAGSLREPLSGAARATALVLTRVDPGIRPESVLDPLREALGRNPQPILVQFRPDGLLDPLTDTVEDLAQLRKQGVLAFSGIANPASFRRTLEGQGARVLDEMVFPDHHAYSASDVGMIRSRAQACGTDLLVTTEKDAVKVRSLLTPADKIRAVRLETVFLEGQSRFQGLLTG
jgi:tetraacyldisaccharide 4'-kinase